MTHAGRVDHPAQRALEARGKPGSGAGFDGRRQILGASRSITVAQAVARGAGGVPERVPGGLGPEPQFQGLNACTLSQQVDRRDIAR